MSLLVFTCVKHTCMCVCVCVCMCVREREIDGNPTLRDVTAHDGHLALVYQVAQGHVPAGRAALACVTGLTAPQRVDVDAEIGRAPV